MNPPRILVFAHKPPPHHGQSQMVQFLVDGFSDGKRGIQIRHVNAQLSSGASDIGSMRPGKLLTLVGYLIQACFARFSGGYSVFYYVPAPAKRSAMYRDWMVLGLCRCIFPRLVLHWHAVGLGSWLQQEARPWEKWLTRRVLGRADLSLSLSRLTASDAGVFSPKETRVVPNGILDPIPDFAQRMAPVRERRFRGIQAAMQEIAGPPFQVNVLFLALCSRDKGVFDAFHAVVMANEQLRSNKCRVHFHLVVAGEFVHAGDREKFNALIAEKPVATIQGFLDPTGKAAAFAMADLFLFPTYYANEGQPLNLVEAMAWGLPIVTTRWRAVPEILPEDYPGVVEPRDIPALASAMILVLGGHFSHCLRERYLEKYTVERHLDCLGNALRELSS